MDIESWKLVVSVLGFGGTIITIALGIRQFRRAEQWKRGEFIAQEIKTFEDDPAVRRVYAAIDWAERRMNLTGELEAPREKWTLVTRDFLWRALLPHEVNARQPEWRPRDREYLAVVEGGSEFERELSRVDLVEDGEGYRAQFTRTSAAVRDDFDTFFDGLSRFGNFIATGLITAEEIRPFIDYWLHDLATDQGRPDDARWRCAVLTYMFAYEFQGAVTLFVGCGYDVDPDGSLFSQLARRMEDGELFRELYGAASKTSPALLAKARQTIAARRDADDLFG